jgi:hypothetical protein
MTYPDFCHPIEPVCAHFGFVLILCKPGLNQPFPDEFTSIILEFRTFPVFWSDRDTENSFKMTPVCQTGADLKNDNT